MSKVEISSFFTKWCDPLDLSKLKKLLDLAYIYPRGVRRGAALFFFWKSVFMEHPNAYAKYANDADYAHMRNMRMRMRIENLIHIIHIWIFAKNGNFLGQKWVSLALFSILSAQNIIIVHTSWFYPSSGMKIKSPKSQNFGQEKMIFFYYWCGLCALMRIWCASMHISKNRRMASPSIDPTLKI